MVRKVRKIRKSKAKAKGDCHKVIVYRKHKGRVQKVKGVRRKSCLKK